MTVKINQWNPKAVTDVTHSVLERRMLKAMVFLTATIKKSISRTRPLYRDAAGELHGADPSKPGEPPKRVTDRLYQSITQEVETSGNFVTGRSGTNVQYAVDLELGNPSANLAPRPFLRPALMVEKSRIQRILTKGR